MLGADGLARLAEPALELGGAAGVEVVVHRGVTGLARFANSEVHQHVATEDVTVTVRAVADGGRTGVVAVTTDDPGEVARAAADALALARLAPPDPDFPGLAPPAATTEVAFDEATMLASPGERTAAVREVLAELPEGYTAAGAYETGGTELGVFTSAGQRATSRASRADVSLVVTGSSSSGWAEAGGRDRAAVDPREVGRRAVQKAERSADPVDIGAGTYPVVLEPAAVATLAQFLAYLGFNGRAYLEDRACTSGRLGEQALDPAVTIVDDATGPAATGLPFDAEGTPRQRVTLVAEGVLSAVVHDRATAAKAGTASTGHALPAPNTEGPMPTSPLLAPGDGGSVDDLIAGLERGLLVTRFHYTNVVHPVETVLTGMTRDGTWLVEDGEIVRPVRNLRFRQSVLAALARVEAVSTETRYAADIFARGARYPALRLPAFTFPSTTTFG